MEQEAACDPEQMVAFLAGNPTKAQAWVDAMNQDPNVALPDGSKLTVATIPQYVATLTPVVLQADTRVTNHGFKDGKATTMQSVLQKDTAVLVDNTGTPRVKCFCGNPLRARGGDVHTGLHGQGLDWLRPGRHQCRAAFDHGDQRVRPQGPQDRHAVQPSGWFDGDQGRAQERHGGNDHHGSAREHHDGTGRNHHNHQYHGGP